MHALGVYHQHTRYDRDNYITVNEDNIISQSAKSQFNKLSESAANVYNTPYSYESVMHYGSSVSIKSLLMMLMILLGTKAVDRLPHTRHAASVIEMLNGPP